MRTSTLFVAVVALVSSSLAVAEERPRFYFPRAVKRQVFLNNTFTTDSPTSSSSSSSTTETTDLSSSTRHTTLSDVISSLTSSDIFPGEAATTDGSTTADKATPLTASSDAQSTDAPTSSTSERVATVIISNTVVIGPDSTITLSPGPPSETTPTVAPSAPSTTPEDTTSDVGSTGAKPSVIVLPTLSSSDPATSDNPTSTADVGTISLKPEVTVIPTLSADPVTSDAVTSTEDPALLSTADLGTTGGMPNVIVLPTATDSTSSDVPTPSSTSSEEGITFGPSGVVTATTETADPTSTTDPATTEPDVTTAPTATTTSFKFDSLTGDVSLGLTFTGTGTGTGTDTGPVVTDTPTITDSSTPVTTETPTSTSVSIQPALTLPTSDISSILDHLSSVLDPTSTNNGITGTYSTGVPTGTGSLPTSTSVPVVVVPTSSDLGSVLSSIIGGTTKAPTSTAVAAPPVSISEVTSNSTIPASTGGLQPSTTTNGTEPTVLVPAVPSVTLFPSTSTKPQPPQAILPTGTNVVSGQWLPSSIIAQPSPTDQVSTLTMASGIPSTLPQVVSPPSGIPSAIPDNTLIQVGFTYALNYEFVVANSMSSAQIFQFLPEGIADGLGLSRDAVVMHSLIPYDTSSTLGFITTLALAYVPSAMVPKLAVAIHTPVSPLYQNKDGSIFTIMSYINPAIPLTPGSTLAGGSATGSGGATDPTASTSSNENGGVFNTDSQNASPTAKATTAGIAIGAAGAAVAYGAAMFLIARRYKRRKLQHRRSRSMLDPSEMTQAGSPALTGGAIMSGGRQTPATVSGGTSGTGDRHSRGSGKSNGNSARTAQISAPMMAENSLGWN